MHFFFLSSMNFKTNIDFRLGIPHQRINNSLCRYSGESVWIYAEQIT